MDIKFHGMGSDQLVLHLEPPAALVADGSEDDLLQGPLEVSADGFAGAVASAHFFRPDVIAFAEELRAFAHAHEGEATLTSYWVDQVGLRVWAPYLAHNSVLEVAIERSETLGSARVDNRLRVTFVLDPRHWDETLSALQTTLESSSPRLSEMVDE